MKKQILLPLAAMLIASPAFARHHGHSSSISLSTTALSFNGSSGNASSQPLTITASGYNPVVIQGLSFSNGTFSDAAKLPATLSNGQSLTVQVAAKPESSAEQGTLTIATSVGSVNVSLSETASQPSSTHQVSLTWKAPVSSSDVVDSYQVNRAASGSSQYSVVGSTTAAGTSWTDTSVQAGKTYMYEVRAVDDQGTAGNPSNTVSLTVP